MRKKKTNKGRRKLRIEEGIRCSQRMALEGQNHKHGIARRFRMKKKKAGKKSTKWQDNGKRTNIWMT